MIDSESSFKGEIDEPRTCYEDFWIRSADCCFRVLRAGTDDHLENSRSGRPLPPVVDPGTPSTQDAPGKPPSDAIVLFDGKDLSQWETGKKEPAKWKVENGYFEVVEKSGAIQTKQFSVIASCTWNSESLRRQREKIRIAETAGYS